MAFSLQVIANHYGISKDEAAAEILLARQERQNAGKTPEPVPLVPGTGKPRLTPGRYRFGALRLYRRF
jgi:hypothetical protein